MDDELQLVLASQEGPARPVAGAVLTWREGGASLIGWRPKRSTSGLVRLAARATGPPGSKPRLEVRSERLQTTRPLGSSPEAAAAAFLRALARRDRAALAALLDVGALQKAARKRAGLEGPIGREEAARFKRVALARLSEEAWLEERGLRQGFASARPGDFASDPLEGDRARVKLKAHPKLVFELAKTNDAWRITALPILTRKGR
ncbi:MAG: hypothetical protein JKY65_13380 [Planctomycetes bacterium]|nr:hypothetical protein [Planctomycetota bacterium]